MKNRAKCKLCGDVIESFHQYDMVYCRCGEIAVDGGSDAMRCIAGNWDNFLRVDDEGNIVVPKVKDDVKPLYIDKWPEENESHGIIHEKLKISEAIKMFDDIRATIESLPQAAMAQPVTHYDLLSLLLVLSAIFRSED